MSTWNLRESINTLIENVDHSDQKDIFEAAISELDIQGNDNGWYLNSGATKHISGGRDSFDSLDKCRGNVKTAGRQNHAIADSGSIKFTLPSGKIKNISDVLYVPSLKKISFL